MIDVCSAALVRGERCKPCICAEAIEYDIIIGEEDDVTRLYDVRSSCIHVDDGDIPSDTRVEG